MNISLVQKNIENILPKMNTEIAHMDNRIRRIRTNTKVTQMKIGVTHMGAKMAQLGH